LERKTTLVVALTIAAWATCLFAGENLLENSSFEAGLYPWRAMPSSMDPLSDVRITDGAAWDGDRSVLFDSSRIRFPATHDRMLSHWFLGEKGKPVTLSVYMKGTPGAKACFGLCAGFNHTEIRQGFKQAKDWRKYVALTTGWKRYHFSTRFNEKKDFYYQVEIVILTGGKIWVDAVQVEHGELTDYHPAADLALGLRFTEPGNLFEIGREVQADVTVWSNADAKRDLKFACTVTAHDGELAAGISESMSLPPRQALSKTVRFTPERRGVYTVDVKLSDAAGRVVATAAARVGVIRYLDKLLSQADLDAGPFGVFAGVPPRPAAGMVLRRTGVRRLRTAPYFLEWKRLEAKKGTFDFRVPDIIYTPEAVRPFSVIWCIRGTPDWASLERDGKKITTPRSLDDYGNYLRKVVERYKDRVRTWEIWNEPDLSWTGTIEEYVALLRKSWQVIKQTDPSALVQGLCPSNTSNACVRWTARALDAGAMKYMDSISFHPYRDASPEETDYVDDIRRIKDLMRKHGGEKRLDITEVGWCAATPEGVPNAHLEHTPHPEDVQAAYLLRMYILSISEGVGTICWFNWGAGGVRMGADPYGLLNADTFGSPKQALVVYNAMVDELEGATFRKRLDLADPDLYAFLFRKDGKPIAVAWSPWGRKAVLCPSTDDVSVLDMYGNPVRLSAARNADVITLSRHPRYITGSSKLLSLVACTPPDGVLAGGQLDLQVKCPMAGVSAAFRPTGDPLVLPGDAIRLGGETRIPVKIRDDCETGIYPLRADLDLGDVRLKDVRLCRLHVAERVPRLTPRIDGDLSEWKSVKPRLLRKKIHYMTDDYVIADSGSKFYLAWDDDAFYFAADIADDDILSKDSGWRDMLTLLLDTRRKKKAYLDDMTFAIVIEPSKDRSNPAWHTHTGKFSTARLKRADIAGRPTPGGYTVEMAVPFDNFPWIEKPEGYVLGFDVDFNNARGSHQGRYVWKGYRHNTRNLSRIGWVELCR